MSDAKAKKAKKGKNAKYSEKKDKKGKKGAAGDGTSVATHPGARAAVRRAKAWGGLGGFAIAALLSLKAGVPADQLGLRAFAAGVAGYLVAWACSVTIWRHLVLAEIHATIEEALQEREEKEDATRNVPSTRGPAS